MRCTLSDIEILLGSMPRTLAWGLVKVPIMVSPTFHVPAGAHHANRSVSIPSRVRPSDVQSELV